MITRFNPLLLLAFPVLLLCSGVYGQETSTGRIEGDVVSRESRHPLSMATVVVEGTRLGASTDKEGEFMISGVPPGTYTLIVRLLGFEEWREEDLVVEPGEATSFRAQLTESAIPMGEIQVTADRARRLEDIRSSVLSVAPVRTKTLAGVAEDVLRTLQALPGVLSPNDFTSQLIVRGSGPDQNLIIVDDIEVFNPYRLYGLISMFNPETVSDISLITGGFPAKYGDRLSAVLDVRNREGDKAVGMKGSLNASISNANLVLTGHTPFGVDGSYVVSARRTYYDLILGPIARNTGLVSGDVAFPNFADVQSKVVFDAAPGNKIITNVLFSRDGVDLMSGKDRSTPDSINVLDRTRNDVLGIAWHHFPSDGFFARVGLSWYRNTGDTEFGGDFIDPALDRARFEGGGDTTGLRLFNVEFDSKYRFRKVSFKSDASWVLPSHLLEIGAGVDLLKTSILWQFRPDETFRAVMLSRGIAFAEDFEQTREYVRLNLSAQDKLRLGERLSVQPGVRIDYYEIIDKAYLSPRLNVSYFLDPLTTLRGAWGVYRQSPGYEKLIDQNTFFDLTSVAVGRLDAERATHYVLGFDRWISNEWQLKVEAYYKDFDDIIVQDSRRGTVYRASSVPGGDPRRRSGWTDPVAVAGDSLTPLPVNGATGRAQGIEILLEKRNTSAESRLSGWIGYALAKTERVRGALRTPFRFDQRHTVNIVLDYRFNAWLEGGVRWKYGTNFPYTRPIGLKPRIVTATQNGQDTKVIQVDADGNVVFDIDRGGLENEYAAQLPPYHRLDVRVTAHADFWGLDWSFYLDVINIYNRKNILNYRFYSKEDLSLGESAIGMLPILPTLGFSVRF